MAERSERRSFDPGPGSRVLLVAACLVVVVMGLKLAAPILVPFSLALLLAILSFPLVYFLQRHRVPSILAILLAVLAIAGILAALVLLATRAAADFENEVPRYLVRFRELYERMLIWLDDRGVPAADVFGAEAVNFQSVIGVAQGTLQRLATLLSTAFLVFLLLIFMLAEATTIPEKLRTILGGEHRDITRFSKVSREVFQYIVIKTLASAATGLLVGVGVALIELDFPILWGLIAFILNFIPTVGSIVAAIPAILLALVQLGFAEALGVTGIYLAINMTIGNFVEPTLLGRRLGISTLVVILSLVFWGWVWGPVGMFLSVPITMVLRILLENTEDFRWAAILISKAPLVTYMEPGRGILAPDEADKSP